MSGLSDALGAITDMFGQRPAVTNEDVARAMVMLESPLTRPAGNDPVSREARRRAVWANAANVKPDEVRKSGLLHYGMTPERYEQAMMWAGIAPMNMIAYHGSPHKFNAFKMEKIGTGEGAQAYGHGLYFAENKNVAKYYRPPESNKSVDWISGQLRSLGAPTDRQTTGAFGAAAFALKNGAPDARVLQDARSMAPALKSVKDDQLLASMKGYIEAGHLYKVDLPDEAVAKMLDWDKPLSQQPESVRKALAEIHNKVQLARGGYKPLSPMPPLKDSMTGKQIYSAIADEIPTGHSGAKYDKASEILRELGIPGIKYLDAGSRSAGEGSRNFVVFDENLPKILERNSEKLRPAK